MCMDTRTGYVKAYVGGPRITASFQYDMVPEWGRRQVGIYCQTIPSIR